MGGARRNQQEGQIDLQNIDGLRAENYNELKIELLLRILETLKVNYKMKFFLESQNLFLKNYFKKKNFRFIGTRFMNQII